MSSDDHSPQMVQGSSGAPIGYSPGKAWGGRVSPVVEEISVFLSNSIFGVSAFWGFSLDRRLKLHRSSKEIFIVETPETDSRVSVQGPTNLIRKSREDFTMMINTADTIVTLD